MTRLGAVNRLIPTPAARIARFAVAKTPNRSPGLATTGSWGCRLIRIDAGHRVSRQPAGLARRRLEEARLVVGNRCPSKNRNIPDESTILAS
jgi:hypothetical protein